MLSPEEILAIGLLVAGTVQFARLCGMHSDWAPPLSLLLGGMIGVVAGLSKGGNIADWLMLFFDGANGGIAGAGVYATGKGMAKIANRVNGEQAP